MIEDILNKIILDIEDIEKRDVMKEAVIQKLDKSLEVYKSEINNKSSALANSKISDKKISISINRKYKRYPKKQ